jgi:hypothetical protein
MVKFSDVFEKHTAYNVRVTQLFQVDAEEKRRIDMRLLYRVEYGSLDNHSYRRQE